MLMSQNVFDDQTNQLEIFRSTDPVAMEHGHQEMADTGTAKTILRDGFSPGDPDCPIVSIKSIAFKSKLHVPISRDRGKTVLTMNVMEVGIFVYADDTVRVVDLKRVDRILDMIGC